MKNTGHNVNVNNIEDVDFVWQGESYTELTGKKNHYDWIIASHVIKHTQDLVGFLNECDSILKDDGIVSLVVPGKRYCFDHYRPITGLSQVVDSHFRKATNHSPGTAAEFYLNVVSRSEKIAWSKKTTGRYRFLHSLEDAQRGIETVRKDEGYFDTHAWCFVPHSFRLIIHDLYHLGLIPFQEVDCFSTRGCEFYVTLGRHGKGVGKSRMEMLKLIESEMRATRFQPWRTARNAAREVLDVFRPGVRKAA